MEHLLYVPEVAGVAQLQDRVAKQHTALPGRRAHVRLRVDIGERLLFACHAGRHRRPWRGLLILPAATVPAGARAEEPADGPDAKLQVIQGDQGKAGKPGTETSAEVVNTETK